MLKEGGGDTMECQGNDHPAGREAPLMGGFSISSQKIYNILVENLYDAIGIFYIEKLRFLPQCPTPLSFLILGNKVLHILCSFICSGVL